MVADFTGKVALVTGAAGGIGSAISERLGAAGASLVLVDRAAPTSLAGELGTHRMLAIAADIGDPDAVDRTVAATLARFRRLDILVNVAGAMIFKPIEEQQADDWNRLLAINLVAPALFTGHALKHMTAGGAIVNISSVHARRTSPMVSSYAASKAALASLTRSTAIEGRERGIRCNAILPGAIETRMLRDSPNIKSGAEVVDPADIGQPDDIAALALFLVSDEAHFITGAEMVADGGRMARL